MRIPQTYTPSPAELELDQYAFNSWNNQGNDNDLFHRHLLNAIRVAIRDELTEQQRTYIVAYYYEGLTMNEIAKRLAVDKSTVSRTIHRSYKKLQRVLRYASPSLLNEGFHMDTRRLKRREGRTGFVAGR